MKPKLYLAGPEVFLPNAVEHAEKQRTICRKYGFQPLHPMDNNLDLGNCDFETAMRIQKGDTDQIEACDIVVANCNGFRGVCMDDGTAFELGYCNALKKISYGYIREDIGLVARTERDWPHTTLSAGRSIDPQGYVNVEDFGTRINLMMECGMKRSGGRLVVGDFEMCLRAIRADIDSGTLLPKLFGTSDTNRLVPK